MRATRAQSLAAVKEGDIVYAIAAGGQEKLMLVYRTTPDTIFARQVTSGTRVEFGRDGFSTAAARGVSVGADQVEEQGSREHRSRYVKPRAGQGQRRAWLTAFVRC